MPCAPTDVPHRLGNCYKRDRVPAYDALAVDKYSVLRMGNTYSWQNEDFPD